MLNKFNKIIVASLLLTMFILLVLSTASESRVFDEITHVTAGYEFITHQDFRFDPFNPPLARELMAIPVLINKNTINDLTLFWPRLVVIIFTILLGLLVFFFSKKLYGKSAGLMALIIFTLEPNMLANGHYAQSDLIFTFFYIFSFYVFLLWKNKFTTIRTVVFGILIGLLLSTKVTALPFFFLPFIFIILYKKNIKKFINKTSLKLYFLKILLFTFSLLIALWSTYFFKMDPMLGRRFDQNRYSMNLAKNNKFIKFALYQSIPLGSYISSIKQQAVFNYSTLYKRDSMILGNISHTGQSGLYFIPLIFIKIPLEITLLFIIILFYFKKKILKDSLVLIPLFSILVISLFTNAIIVLRYILPIIPLMIIYSSQIVKIKYKFKNILICLLILFLALENFSSFPHYISYANLILGGQKNGYKYMFDSNYDWGQPLLSLKKYQIKNNIHNLNLAYFGDINPSLYGLKYNKLDDNILYYDKKDFSKIRTEKNSVYAISTTCWYLCNYYKQPQFSEKEIDDVVGGSILIFKF